MNNNNYLLYNNISIEDGSNGSNILGDEKINCIQECSSENNCLGVNISNPICDSSNNYAECLNENNVTNNSGINSIMPENFSKFNCKILNNINNTNFVLNSENNTSYIKNSSGNLIPMLPNSIYYLKIDNMYLSINNEYNQIFLVGNNNIGLASLFKFNSNGNIVEVKTNKCLQTNGEYLILTNCDSTNINQEFIYENKLKTIRPITNTTNNALCLTLDSTNKITLEECSNTSEQKIISESENQIDNFDSDGLSINTFKNINFCSNPTYQIIVNVILCCIIIYFIWFICRKTYKDNSNDDIILSTPFK